MGGLPYNKIQMFCVMTIITVPKAWQSTQEAPVNNSLNQNVQAAAQANCVINTHYVSTRWFTEETIKSCPEVATTVSTTLR